MFDTSRALSDMANQIRACRSQDALTLQQLAARSGVAASTIHKVEAQQMVPTVTVLLKIAKGLGRRPQDLIRDIPMPGDTGSLHTEASTKNSVAARSLAEPGSRTLSQERMPEGEAASSSKRKVGVWQINLSAQKMLPTLDLHPLQRAILLVQKGELDLQAGKQRIQMDTGDCIEVQGERIESRAVQPESASVMLIVSPPGNLDMHLGQPTRSAPIFS